MADTSTDNITVEKLKSNSPTGWVVKQGGRPIRQIEKKEKSEKNPNPSWTDTYFNEEGKQKCIAVYSGTLAISEKNLPPEIHSPEVFYNVRQSGTHKPTHFIEFKNDNGQEMMVSYNASGEKNTYMKDENDEWVEQQSTASVQTQSVEQTEQPTASVENTPQPVQTEQPTASATRANGTTNSFGRKYTSIRANGTTNGFGRKYTSIRANGTTNGFGRKYISTRANAISPNADDRANAIRTNAAACRATVGANTDS